MTNIIIHQTEIKSKIHTVRNQQVMLDKDLAELYSVKPIRLREQVKRNIKRFPIEFMFQLNDNEINSMVSQNAIPSKQHLGGSKPYVFTEQGVSMLSAVLKSDTAIAISISIINSFVSMRKVISLNEPILQRLEVLEKRQIVSEIKNDDKFNKIFNALESKNQTPEQVIFFNGKIFDAHSFIIDLIKSAKSSIVLIDGYIDNTTLNMLSNNQDANITIISHKFNKVDINKYNKQYKPLKTKIDQTYHDRYLSIDDNTVYNIGASIKDVGSKTFTVTLLNDFTINDVINKK